VTLDDFGYPVYAFRPFGFIWLSILSILSVSDEESIYRRKADNTMAKRKSTKGETTIYKTYT
jgi:hypothetical protein